MLVDIFTGWSGDDLFLPQVSYLQLVDVANALNNLGRGVKVYFLEQGFSDGSYNGIVVVDIDNSQILILGNRISI